MRTQRGSVSVEFAALLPLLAVTMLLVAQIGLLVAEQVVLVHAAREGARAAAVSTDVETARARAIEAGNLDPARATVAVTPETRAVGDPILVTVSYRPAVITMIERFVPGDITLRAEASMRAERAAPD